MQYWENIIQIQSGNEVEGYTHASVPIALFIKSDQIRIFFSRRDKSNRSLPFFVDIDLDKMDVIQVSVEPLMCLGAPGTFDDNGVMPTDIVKVGDEIWMYYIGWNTSSTVPFRNSIGLAISKDGGTTFKRKFQGPVLDRTATEPYFVASCSVLNDNNNFKIWYLSCIKWEPIEHGFRHFYNIKYATSIDGINWIREGITAIDFKSTYEYAISVPRVIYTFGLYKMWYSYRASIESSEYRIGYAESEDGIRWIRKDQEINLMVNNNCWCSIMQCYPYIFEYNGATHMIFNGNKYGETGFGICSLKS